MIWRFALCEEESKKKIILQSLDMKQMKNVRLVDCEDIKMWMNVIFFLGAFFKVIICNTMLAVCRIWWQYIHQCTVKFLNYMFC
jgi:hypothetical protein